MSVLQETLALRRELSAMEADPEWGLLVRYDLLRRNPSLPWASRVFRRARQLLADLELMSPYISSYSWLATLEHASVPIGAVPLLIWAPGKGRDAIRQACDGFLQLLADQSELAPVLVTDVADFAYYSRLGWLVEYLPELTGSGEPYRDRKCRYLAWCYRDGLAVPLSAGLASRPEWDELLGSGHR